MRIKICWIHNFVLLFLPLASFNSLWEFIFIYKMASFSHFQSTLRLMSCMFFILMSTVSIKLFNFDSIYCFTYSILQNIFWGLFTQGNKKEVPRVVEWIRWRGGFCFWSIYAEYAMRRFNLFHVLITVKIYWQYLGRYLERGW